MLDPLSALSVAGNAIQFADFGIKILSKSSQLYKSVNGTLPAHEELELVTRDLVNLTSKLTRPSPLLQDQAQISPTKDDDELVLDRICIGCRGIAKELQTHLAKLKVNNENGKWESFRQAIRSEFTENQLQELQKRLKGYQDSLELHIVVGLWKKVDLMNVRLSDRFRQLDNDTQTIISALIENNEKDAKHMHDQTLALTNILWRVEKITETQKSLVEDISRIRTQLEEDDLLRANKRGLNQASRVRKKVLPRKEREELEEVVAMKDFKEQHIWDEELKTRRATEDSILKSLEFETMTERQEAIEAAHAKTFQWIFKDESEESLQPWSNFSQWLEKGSGIYWVNGKAASGKSTLIRFIYGNRKTHELLGSWASLEPLCTGVFYFWNSGNKLQRSQVGLLRALLYEILRQKRALIPVIFPQQWAALYAQYFGKPGASGEEMDIISRSGYLAGGSGNWGSNNIWTLSELMRAFTTLVTQESVLTKICLFVDGLDEYDGDYEEMATMFQNITSPHVKVCVSSRPLLIFEDSFGTCPRLRLQDLTFHDIKIYVTDKLESNGRFLQLLKESPKAAPALVTEIVTIAAGVFLWVKLVVRSLLQGLGNRDGISDLHRRLRLLPADLEKLYKHMLTNIDPFYLQQASEIFQIVRRVGELYNSELNPQGGHQLLTLLGLSFARAEDRYELLQSKARSLESEDILSRLNIMSGQLKSRCAGLLESDEVSTWAHGGNSFLKDASGPVRYLHRTVRDFMELEETWTFLTNQTAKTDFNPSMSFLTACVLLLKYNIRDKRLANKTAETAMLCARQVDPRPGPEYSKVLDCLDSIMTQHHEGWVRNFYGFDFDNGHWSREVTDHVEPLQWRSTFVSYAVQYGLVNYVRGKLSDDCSKRGRPLLHYATDDRSQEAAKSCFSTTMVEFLLQYGAKPNKEFEGSSAWENTLSHINQRSELVCDREVSRELRGICTVMLINGANPNVSTLEKSVWAIITKGFLAAAPADTLELQALLKKCGGREQVSRLGSLKSWSLR